MARPAHHHLEAVVVLRVVAARDLDAAAAAVFAAWRPRSRASASSRRRGRPRPARCSSGPRSAPPRAPGPTSARRARPPRPSRQPPRLGAEGAAEVFGKGLVDVLADDAADVVGLEDGGIDLHGGGAAEVESGSVDCRQTPAAPARPGAPTVDPAGAGDSSTARSARRGRCLHCGRMKITPEPCWRSLLAQPGSATTTAPRRPASGCNWCGRCCLRRPWRCLHGVWRHWPTAARPGCNLGAWMRWYRRQLCHFTGRGADRACTVCHRHTLGHTSTHPPLQPAPARSVLHRRSDAGCVHRLAAGRVAGQRTRHRLGRPQLERHHGQRGAGAAHQLHLLPVLQFDGAQAGSREARHRSAVAPAASPDRTALPVQHAGQCAKPDGPRPAPGQADAGQLHRLPACQPDHAAQRQQPGGARAGAGRKLPATAAGAHGRPAAVQRQR
jgi:hypothetical protein